MSVNTAMIRGRVAAFVCAVCIVLSLWCVPAVHGQYDDTDQPCSLRYRNVSQYPVKCYHNGTCMVSIIAGMDPFPFCACVKPYAGMQCERMDMNTAGMSLFLIIGIPLAILVLLSIGLLAYYFSRKRRLARQGTANEQYTAVADQMGAEPPAMDHGDHDGGPLDV